MSEFVEQTKTLVGALGWDLFREMRGRLAETTSTSDEERTALAPDLRFSCRGEGFAAEMELGPTGDFLVLEGSKARIRETSSIPRATRALRQRLIDAGVMRPGGDNLIFSSDYSFSSASAAAATVIGASVNGRILWKLADGRSYDDWEANQASVLVAGTTSTDRSGA